MSGEDLGADWGAQPEDAPRTAASRKPPEGFKAPRPFGKPSAKPVSDVPTWQEAIFPSLSKSDGNPMQNTGALVAGLRDIAALPVNLVSGAVDAIGAPINKSEAFRQGMAGRPGDMSQTDRAIMGASFAGTPLGSLARAAIPASMSKAPLVRGLADLARYGAAGAAESVPAAAIQATGGEPGAALGSLAVGGVMGAGLRGVGKALQKTGSGAGNIAESMTGIPESDLRKIGIFGSSEYGQKVLSVAENRKQHVNELGDAFLDRVRNFDQYLPNAGEIDEIVANLPPVDGKRVIAAFEKAKPKIKATPESEGAIAKIDQLSEIATGLMDETGKIPASIARQIRQEYDQVIGDAFGKESSAYVNALKNGRHEIAKALEDAAAESGKPEYAAAMKDYTTKLGALDDVMRKLGGDKKTQEDRIESYLSNLFQGNKTDQQEKFKALSDIMGADFAERAQLLNDAKRIAPTGKIPLISAHKTGKAGLGGGVAGVGYGIASGNPVMIGSSLLGMGLGSPAIAPGLISVADRVSQVAGNPLAGGLARMAGRAGRAMVQSQLGDK